MHVKNLEALQAILEDCLFSVRYVNGANQDTPLTDEDHQNLNLKLKEVHSFITSLIPEIQPDSIPYLPNLYESNHIKKTRDWIFIKAVNVFLKYCNENNKTFNEDHLESAEKIATDSIEKLYGVKL